MAQYRIGYDARMFGGQFTGIGRYNYELLLRMLDAAWWETHMQGFGIQYQDIQWVVFAGENEIPAIQKISGANIEIVPTDIRHYSVKEQTHLWKLLNKHNLDCVHFPNFNVPVLYRGKYVVTVHDMTVSLYPGKKNGTLIKRAGYQVVMRNALRTAKRVISVSEHSKKDIVRMGGITEEKIIPVLNGGGEMTRDIPEAEKERVRKKYKLSKSYMFYNGNWKIHKNIPRMVEAFGLMCEKMGKKAGEIELVLTGKPEPEDTAVQEAIAKSKYKVSIRTIGWVDEEDRLPLFAASMMYVQPSLYEGFGIAPIEAMKYGVPVVCSGTTSLPEVCSDAAMYFDPTRVDDMAEKIFHLAHNKAKQESMQKKGLRRATNFTWDKATEETLNVYKEVLQ